MNRRREQFRYRVYEIIEVRTGFDRAGRIYDAIYMFCIILNLQSAFFLPTNLTGNDTGIP